jgi:transposase-like protein
VREAVRRFAVEYGPKYPEALMTLEKDADVLLTFFDFPAEHWKHLRTSTWSSRHSRRCAYGSASRKARALGRRGC